MLFSLLSVIFKVVVVLGNLEIVLIEEEYGGILFIICIWVWFFID